MMKAPELLALEADLSNSSRVPEEDLEKLFDEGQKYLLSQYSFLANRSYQKILPKLDSYHLVEANIIFVVDNEVW